jgi:hypothetical protein
MRKLSKFADPDLGMYVEYNTAHQKVKAITCYYGSFASEEHYADQVTAEVPSTQPDAVAPQPDAVASETDSDAASDSESDSESSGSDSGSSSSGSCSSCDSAASSCSSSDSDGSAPREMSSGATAAAAALAHSMRQLARGPLAVPTELRHKRIRGP